MTAVVWRPGPTVSPAYGNPWFVLRGTLAGKQGLLDSQFLWKLEVYQGVADLHPVMISLEDKFEDDNQTPEHICQKFSV